eukprot:630467-Amorphochlora_amoeboformis.AAC.2
MGWAQMAHVYEKIYTRHMKPAQMSFVAPGEAASLKLMADAYDNDHKLKMMQYSNPNLKRNLNHNVCNPCKTNPSPTLETSQISSILTGTPYHVHIVSR